MTKAIHVSENDEGGGSIHAVGVGDLKVMIICDADNEWYAQGLEIDYLAQGADLEAVKRAFEDGLTATITEHLKLYGDITAILKPAPLEVWSEFYEHATSGEYHYSHVTGHVLDVPTDAGIMFATTEQPKPKALPQSKPKKKKPTRLPFSKITYLEQCA